MRISLAVFAFLVGAQLPARARGADASLQDQLLKEPAAAVVKAARERGDAGRGAVLFFQPFLTCAKCHDGDAGTQLGPDLAKAGKEATAEYLVESVLNPSKVMKKGYETVVVTTKDERSLTGLVVSETADSLTLVDPSANGKRVTIAKADIEKRTTSAKSLMPEGLVNLLSDRQQFLDLAKYLIEIAEGGPARAKELRPAVTALVIPDYEKDIDHAGLIRALDDKALRRGEAIYTRVCANCHGTKDQPGSLPTSPKFASHVFKNGSDPFSLYQTLTRGYGLMAPQTWMVPRQKYDLIHYLREVYLKPYNPAQYAKADDAYLAKLPVGKKGEFGPAAVNVEPWVTMDYGPSLMNTYEVGGGRGPQSLPAGPRQSTEPNIAYKGIAVRLDAGAGGASRGKRWALFDHDTMRFAAAWTGDGFIDWKGIHFNGQHQVHPKLAGDVHFANPVGPGWADPATSSFKDPRFLGRDRRPYGPLPREWAAYRGLYHFGDQTIVSYTVGDAPILELAGAELDAKRPAAVVFTRILEIGKSSRELLARVAPTGIATAVIGDNRVSLEERDGFTVLRIPASATPARVKVLTAKGDAAALKTFAKDSPVPRALEPLTHGGPKRWPEVLKAGVTIGKNDGPFAVDTFALPERNPWNAQLRLTGFDFYPDGKRMAVCSWDGDVWLVSGIDKLAGGLTWQRIASGLFQPLGLKLRDGAVFVCCRDQIVKLHDLNGDGETDFYECFNNDHQVTEHFHEFAMGLQTDADGNFYYAKSGRHALPALVPHHGTLLKVSKDGAKTEILATGFRAANGVCLNLDGTFFVTDQEGFWTPKNRINLVEQGGFYGNMWGYTDVTDTSDSAMKQPLCWITNDFDRSPAELIWVTSDKWGPLKGSLLNTSYGAGKIYVVPHETVSAYAWFDRWLAERKEPREEEIKVTPRAAKELLVCADGQVNVTYKSRPLLPLVAEEFRRKKEKPPRVALKDLLGMDPDRADFHLTKTDAVGKSENPHVICVNGNEAAGWESEDAFVTALGKAGFGVTVVDPRGVGKLRPAGLEVKGHLYADPLCGVEENIAYNAFLVGKNLVGMRVADVLKAVAKVQGDTKATKVVLCGRRDSALVACFAAAVDPSIHAVAVEEMPLSFWPLFEPEGRAINAASILPRLLRDYGDIAAVLAAVAPRKLLASASIGKLEQQLANLDQSEKRLTTDPDVLLDWLKH